MTPLEQKLLSLLSNNDVTFFIPPYQRNYEWEIEQCRIFLNDVVKTSDSNASGNTTEHFFGTITYFQTEKVFGQPSKLVLIDGQQRITTTMLFLVAFREVLDDDDMRNFIDTRYLKNNNVSGDSEYKIKLKQVETDWETYKKIILSDGMSDINPNSSVYQNYLFFYNKLMSYKKEGKDLRKIIETGLEKFSVITIELEPEMKKWENPQEIFESMNSIGKPLSLADLVRNYLLLGLSANTQNELYNRYWLNIEKTIPRKVSDYIRDYMQAIKSTQYPKATEKNYKVLYSIFKDIFSTKDSKDLLKDLYENAELYSFIVYDKTTGDKHIDHELSDIRRLKVTTAYSFLLVLLKYWKSEKISSQGVTDILSAFKIYCIRRRILGLTKGENLGFPTYVDYLDDIAEADDKKQKMFQILSNQANNLRLPNDDEIKDFLDTMNFYSFNQCKFILALIEEKLTKSRPDLNDDNLQIEHIMPQKLNAEWIRELGSDSEVHHELVHKLGNLTLIRHNQELGNKSFAEKKIIYEKNAGLQIAKTLIIDQDRWYSSTIYDRQDWLRDYLLKEVLPIPDSMRNANNYKYENSYRLSFNELNLVGSYITFCDDKSIIVRVVNDKEVEFEGEIWSMTAITREIQTRRGRVNNSGSYQGARYWEYNGTKLIDLGE